MHHSLLLNNPIIHSTIGTKCKLPVILFQGVVFHDGFFCVKWKIRLPEILNLSISWNTIAHNTQYQRLFEALQDQSWVMQNSKLAVHMDALAVYKCGDQMFNASSRKTRLCFKAANSYCLTFWLKTWLLAAGAYIWNIFKELFTFPSLNLQQNS